MLWTIEKGGGRESGISVLMVWHDDDDDAIPIPLKGIYSEYSDHAFKDCQEYWPEE